MPHRLRSAGVHAVAAAALVATTLAVSSPVAQATVPAARPTTSPPTGDPAMPGQTSAMDVPTPAQRILPTPRSLETRSGSLTFDATSVVDVGRHPKKGTVAVATFLGDFLRTPTGYGWEVVRGSHAANRVVLKSGGPASLGKEGYRLDVGRRAVTIEARTSTGLFHGVQTLRQLMPAAVEKHERVEGTTWTIPRVRVSDAPRYPVRGAMLDVARHFMSVAEVKAYIDAMVPLKLNTFELHLADDQGWRLEIKSWPRLATYGGALETGGTKGGSYTQAEYTELVAYAKARHITLVPEIDLPGHTNAALASYAELNCDGKAPERYTGTDVGFSSLCASKDVTYRFLSDVLGEIAALTPGRYISIGGDEAHSTTQADYTKMVDAAQRVLRQHGKRMWGWHQTASADPAKRSIAAYWGTAGSKDDIALARQAAKKGQRIVMAPADHAYLDMKYTPSFPYGQDWAAVVKVSDSYAWDPATLVPGVPSSAVAGVLAPVWTETLPDITKVELMAFPRLAGIAQIGWSPRRTHALEPYLVQLAVQGPRWEAAGVDFYRSPEVAWHRFG
ncbi:beta-N-acetylhexosaminidase [Microlunatus flavus]|uniref:beta-N-acetylhexosaminidase n=1 Tax=Microlunatus flavus TaxID=1036181 RepID=A0A1H9HHG2_9ACTN|nr:beta-N-acetylhexosaminidase [Microlunatus flavus]SEQ61755.1 hexosaminidase [Microlunatus flavus]